MDQALIDTRYFQLEFVSSLNVMDWRMFFIVSICELGKEGLQGTHALDYASLCEPVLPRPWDELDERDYS